MRAALRASPGEWLQRIAVTHAAVGVISYRAPLGDIAHSRVIAAVADGDRATAFWYMTAAPLLWTSGRLLRSAEGNDDLGAQRHVGCMLIAAGSAGAAAMPAGGLWAVIAVGIGTIRRTAT